MPPNHPESRENDLKMRRSRRGRADRSNESVCLNVAISRAKMSNKKPILSNEMRQNYGASGACRQETRHP